MSRRKQEGGNSYSRDIPIGKKRFSTENADPLERDAILTADPDSKGEGAGFIHSKRRQNSRVALFPKNPVRASFRYPWYNNASFPIKSPFAS